MNTNEPRDFNFDDFISECADMNYSIQHKPRTLIKVSFTPDFRNSKGESKTDGRGNKIGIQLLEKHPYILRDTGWDWDKSNCIYYRYYNRLTIIDLKTISVELQAIQTQVCQMLDDYEKWLVFSTVVQ